jgi:glycosyltransferase involved in cell wall biosynthesis
VPDSLTIVMPTYNGMRYLKYQIESILCQTFGDFELLISDDASSDETCEILDYYACNDPRIKIMRQARNLGFKKNFELLLRESTRPYVALADQDDIWVPNHIELLMKNIGDRLIVCANSELIDGEGRSMGRTMMNASGIEFVPSDKEAQLQYLLYGNFVQGCTTLISRNLIDLALPIPDNVRFHDYWLASVAAVFCPIVYIDEIIVKYRQHTSNVIGSDRKPLLGVLKAGRPEAQNICESLLSRFGPILQDIQISQLKEATRHWESRSGFGPGVFCAFNTFRQYEAIYWSRSHKLRWLRIIKALVGF